MVNHRQEMVQNLEEYIEQIMKIMMGSRDENEEFENLCFDL